MKNNKFQIIIFIISLLIVSAISYHYGKSAQNELHRNLSINDLLNLVKDKEIENIDHLVTESLEFESDYYYEKAVCRGYIYNNAVVVKAKDVKIVLDYYTKTKSLIDTDTIEIYEYVNPKDSIYINVPIVKPKLTSQVDIKIQSVKVE